jgi:hypothetical protein
MPFIKGISGNPNGRPVGAVSKEKSNLRAMITTFLEGNFEKVLSDFDELPPRDRIKFYLEFLQYGIAKLQAVPTDGEFEHLSEDQLDTLIHKITNGIQ